MSYRNLLVEDEASPLILQADVFTDNGFIVSTVSDGEEAIRLLNEQNGEFDAVFTDLGLPGRGRWQVLNFI